VHEVLAGVDLLLHAGDIGGEDILMELALIAPVRAVYGNTDRRPLPGVRDAIDDVIGGLRVHVSHGHELGAPRVESLVAAYDADVILYGHTHVPLIERTSAGVLVVNPGAAGPPRHGLAPSVGVLVVGDGEVRVELFDVG
jgi:putative phosphoesterase